MNIVLKPATLIMAMLLATIIVHSQSISINDSILVIHMTGSKDLTPSFSSEKISKLKVIQPDDPNWFVESFRFEFKKDDAKYFTTFSGGKLPNMIGMMNTKSPKLYFDEVILKMSNGKTIKLNFQLIPIYPD